MRCEAVLGFFFAEKRPTATDGVVLSWPAVSCYCGVVCVEGTASLDRWIGGVD